MECWKENKINPHKKKKTFLSLCQDCKSEKAVIRLAKIERVIKIIFMINKYNNWSIFLSRWNNMIINKDSALTRIFNNKMKKMENNLSNIQKQVEEEYSNSKPQIAVIYDK